VDVIACGAPTGHYQLQLAQSADTGATWASSMDLSNDTAHTYFLPDMVRDSCRLHVVVNSSGGPKYFHSSDGGTTWDVPVPLPGCSFIAFTGDVLHIVYVNAYKIKYIRNPTGNGGQACPLISGITEVNNQSTVSIYPNPTSGIFTVKDVETRLIASLPMQILIYDVTGREVYHQTINNSTLSTINISNLSTGVYFYKLTNEKETLRGKFVKE
jgi:hypothetical protein